MGRYELTQVQDEWSGEFVSVLSRDGKWVASDCPSDCPEDATLNRHFSGVVDEVFALARRVEQLESTLRLSMEHLDEFEFFKYDILPQLGSEHLDLFRELQGPLWFEDEAE